MQLSAEIFMAGEYKLRTSVRQPDDKLRLALHRSTEEENKPRFGASPCHVSPQWHIMLTHLALLN